MRALASTGPMSASAGRRRLRHVNQAPSAVARLPKTTSSMPSIPVPESAMLARLAMAQPSARPGTASAVKSARTHAASETRNCTGPQARLPRKSRAQSVRAA